MQVAQNEPPDTHTVVKQRAITGAKFLGLRTAASLVLRAISSISLAHLLFPRDYGIFGVASYITGLGMFFGDVGLSAALVRNHREPTDDETTTVFWFNQLLTGAIVTALIIAAPGIVHASHLPGSACLMLVMMSLALFLSSFRIIPMMMLERRLKFPA
ncbi:MAG: oligosaccharide flippase family protein, partial [Capsulimonadaceae bacterium]